jgi:hypothetical protein
MPKSADKRGRSLTKERFALVPVSVMRSAAYQRASLPARAILFELAALYAGTNNGHLGLSVRQAATLLHCAKDTASRAFRELSEKGLIEAAYIGNFKAKVSPLASEWRLSWRRCDRSGALPSRAFLNWKPHNANLKSGTTGRTVRSDREDSSAKTNGERYGQKDTLSPSGSSAVPIVRTLLESPTGGADQ